MREINGAAPKEQAYRLSRNDFIIPRIGAGAATCSGRDVAWAVIAILRFRHSDSLSPCTGCGLIVPVHSPGETTTECDLH